MGEELRALVKGRVQMVMYRDFVQRKARGLGLSGFVRNLVDGSVEVVAQGERAKLEILAAKLKKGSLLSRVESVDLDWHPIGEVQQGFRIAYHKDL